MNHAFPKIQVRKRTDDRRRGWLSAGPLRFPCALGRSGTTHRKREGDGATPIGRLSFGRVWWRADRLQRPSVELPLRRTTNVDGWCDDRRHPRYNRAVALPFPASHEAMWRKDDVYDIVVELGWNVQPAIKGRGSAIFLHVARPDYAPTEGCVALRRDHLLRLLKRISPGATLEIIG